MAHHSKSLTPEVFHHLKQIELESCSEKIMTNYINKVENILTSFPFEIKKQEFVKAAAKDIIVKKKRVFDGTEQSINDLTDEKRTKADEMYNMARIFHQAMPNCFLVIQSDRDASSEILNSHYCNICKVFPIANLRPGSNVLTDKKFNNYADIKKQMADFFHHKEMKCRHATVIFSGYISSKQELVLYDKETPVTMDTFVKDVIEYFKRITRGKIIPYSLDIVYVENCSVEVSDVHYSDIHVVSVTVEETNAPQHNTVTVYSKTSIPQSNHQLLTAAAPRNVSAEKSLFESSSSFFGEGSLARSSQFDEEEIPGLDYVDKVA